MRPASTQNTSIFVPTTPLSGGGTIQTDFLSFIQSILPIIIFIVEKCEWYH